jgi:uncharacterized membrane protein
MVSPLGPGEFFRYGAPEDLTMILTVHTAFGLIALAAGALNLVSQKGTPRHRLIGWIYAGSMAGLIGTSFAIFELFGGFGPFHAMSLVSGGTLALALYFPMRRSRYDNWLEHHYMWITWSYVGLVMATGSHLFQYGPPGWPSWARAALYWGLPCAVGAALIFGWRSTMLSRVSSEKTEEGTL